MIRAAGTPSRHRLFAERGIAARREGIAHGSFQVRKVEFAGKVLHGQQQHDRGNDEQLAEFHFTIGTGDKAAIDQEGQDRPNVAWGCGSGPATTYCLRFVG